MIIGKSDKYIRLEFSERIVELTTIEFDELINNLKPKFGFDYPDYEVF